MKANDTGRTRRNRQGGIGMKKPIALLLSLAMVLAMLCATAEDSDGMLLPGDAIQAVDGELYLGDESAADDGSDMKIELPDEAMPDVDALVIDGAALDGLEDNVIAEELAELDAAGDEPAAAQASNESNPEDFEIDENGVLVRYNGAGGDVVIPDGVVSIGWSAFSECSNVTSVTIPNGVTNIDDYAFSYCSYLRSVTIPDGVTNIGNNVFDGCSSLWSVTIPSSVASIGVWLFNGCVSLRNVTILGDVTSIGTRAFYNCSRLVSLTIPDSVTSIGELTFYNCSSLTSVTIPGSVTSIGDAAFDGCESLTSVTIPDGIISIGGYMFRDCSSMTSVTIPGSVTSIGDDAFGGCKSLTSVTIPGSVTSIGKAAFDGCESLTSVTILDGVTSIGDFTFEYCSSLTSVTIPGSVTRIGDYAFYECSSLMSVEIPDSVTSIGDRAFSSSGLTSVTIPGSVISIGDEAFMHCHGLTSVTIPNSVTSIGSGEFRSCWNLTKITIPNSVTSIADDAFSGCEDLIIYGMTGSYAETYANKNDIPFIAIETPTAAPTATPTAVPSAKPTATPTVTPVPTTTPVPTATPRTSLAKAKLTVKAQVYTGKALKPAVKVVLNKKTLKKGTDYTVSYKNNVKPGTATVTVKGKGNYTGTVQATFAIRVPLSKCKLTVKGQVYTGKVLKPAVTVKFGSKTLKKGTDYTVTYKNNKAIGTATVTVKGKGSYTGTAKATFKINPKAVTGLNLTAGKGQINASWKKPTGGVGGYQLQYALKKDFSGGKKVTISKASTLKATLKKLKAGKTYYVRIRTYKKVGKTTYWSAWSAAKTAKVK